MDEERLNLSKFLKQVGVTSQREIEIAVRQAAQSGTLASGPMEIKVRLECPELGLVHTVEGELETS